MPASLRCDGCAVELLPDSLFCHACGRRVAGGADAAPALHGERKPLTVLFVETFGSIGLDQRVDVERWHDLVERFFSVVQAAVQRFGGTVDRLTDEGIKVLFGAPTALESHARQACHAALHLATDLARFGEAFRDRAGVTFSVRMGLASGEVVFGPVGGVAGVGFTSQGHTAALASRMLELAPPGRIFLTESTARQVADFFDLAEVGALPIRGAREDVRVHELLRARDHRSRLDVARERGLTRFIGRTSEMAALENALRLAQETGHRVVGIAGEPGIGKSRLCDEFAERVRERGLAVHAARCVEHGRWMPFHATLAFLRRELAVDEDQPAAAQREHIVQRLRSIDPALEEVVPVVYATLGLAPPDSRPTVAGTPARELARVVRGLVEIRSPRGVSLVVIDDQQWMDPGSAAIFDTLIAEPPRTPVLVVVSYRREHQRGWMRHPDFVELALRPLGRDATLELVAELLGGDASLGEVPERIAERAAGNPFFVEEMVRSLVEARAFEGQPGAYRLARGVSDVAVPTSLQAVLAARIDQLGSVEKQTLQAAAVIGREFSVPLLAALTGHDVPRLAPILRSLEASDFVSCIGWGERLEYVFRHPLLCETAYRSLLSERRAALHRRLARELSHLHGDGAGRRAAQLALHYEAAGDAFDAAVCHRQAALENEQWDPVQALTHWRRVWCCTAKSTDEPALRLRLAACEAIVRLGIHQTLEADEVNALIDEGRAIAAALGERATTALLLSTQGALLGAKGDVAGAVSCSVRALEIARQLGDPELLRLCGTRLALCHRRTGNLRAALAAVDAALAVRDDAPAEAQQASLHRAVLARVAALIDLGELSTAESELHRVTIALRREGASMALAWALTLASRLIRFSGNAAPSLVGHAEEGYALARRLGVPSLLARARASLAMTRLFQDEAEEARSLALEAASANAGAGAAFYADVDPLLIVAYADGRLGALERARDAATAALHGALEQRFAPGQIDALLCLGRIALGLRDPALLDEARRLLLHALVLVRRTGARSREPHIWLELARHTRSIGDERRCRARQRRAVRLLLAMDALGHVRRAARVLAADERTAGLLLAPPRPRSR